MRRPLLFGRFCPGIIFVSSLFVLGWLGIQFSDLEAFCPIDPINAGSVSDDEEGPGRQAGGGGDPRAGLSLAPGSAAPPPGLIQFTSEDYTEPKDKHMSVGRS